MMKIQKSHYLLVLFLFLHSIVLSQVKSIGIPEIRNYKRTDYKGGTQNWNIDQDVNHNLYFANNAQSLLIFLSISPPKFHPYFISDQFKFESTE